MEVFPLLVVGLSIAAMNCDSAKRRFHTAAFLIDWAVSVAMKNDVSICKVKFQTSPMEVYVHTHLSKEARFLLLIPS